jgi:hypothetical protein
MPKRQRKVILIGARGYERVHEGVRVECFPWDKIIKIKNIRDYDTVILNLLPLRNEASRKAVSWSVFLRLLDFTSAMDILVNGGAIVVVGDPRFDVPVEQSKKKNSQPKLPFLAWTGINFFWDPEPGDTVHFEDDYRHRQYEVYVSKLNKWCYSLDGLKQDKDKLHERFNVEYLSRNRMKIAINKDKFCYNRYKNALAFALRYQLLREGYARNEVLQTYGPIIFLPEISFSEDETIQLVLRDICGIQASLPEPEWLVGFSAPGQKAVDESIRRIEAELKSIVERLEKTQEKREECRDCLKLLYERELALEPVVRDILRGLGAHVEDPTEKNKEDGWIVVKVGETTYEGVLEIKSTRNETFGEEGRKQLLDWIDRGRSLRGKNYKGIFIGNSAVDKPLKERPWAFSSSWTKAAELSQICVMKTEDLYVIHLLNARGLIDIERFWKELFENNGIFDMKRYWELLAPKEKAEKE